MTKAPSQNRIRTAKIMFGVMALVSVLLGLIIYIFSDNFGLEPNVAKLIALAFLLAGALDYILLRNWERFMRGKS